MYLEEKKMSDTYRLYPHYAIYGVTGSAFLVDNCNYNGSAGYVPFTSVFGNTVDSREELRCEYCNRLHARGKESCGGCGAPL
jgi:hypothetical protein